MPKSKKSTATQIVGAAREAYRAFEVLGNDTQPSTKDESRKAFFQAMRRLGELLDG